MLLFCIAASVVVFLQVKVIFGLTGHKFWLCSSSDGKSELSSDMKENDVLKLHASTVFVVTER